MSRSRGHVAYLHPLDAVHNHFLSSTDSSLAGPLQRRALASAISSGIFIPAHSSARRRPEPVVQDQTLLYTYAKWATGLKILVSAAVQSRSCPPLFSPICPLRDRNRRKRLFKRGGRLVQHALGTGHRSISGIPGETSLKGDLDHVRGRRFLSSDSSDFGRRGRIP